MSLFEQKIYDIKPLFPYIGSKKKLVPFLISKMPKRYNFYFEPFLGSGALLFALQPKKAIINDVNWQVFNVYKTVKYHSDKLISYLESFKTDKKSFYEIRDSKFKDNVLKAAQFIYIMKLCFGACYRQDKKGKCNASFGYKGDRVLYNSKNIETMSDYLKQSNLIIKCNDYATILKVAKANDFVYLDPPYKLKKINSYYTQKGFYRDEDHINLKKVCDELDKKGVLWMQSNSNIDFIKRLYSKYSIEEIIAPRSIQHLKNSKKQFLANEVIITNY